MRLSGAFLLAQAALGVALVIPTKLDISHEDLAMAMARSRIVRLDCTGCPGEGRQQLVGTHVNLQFIRVLTVPPVIRLPCRRFAPRYYDDKLEAYLPSS